VAAAAAAEVAVEAAEAAQAVELALAAEAALELAAELVAQWGWLPVRLAGELEAAAHPGERAAGAKPDRMPDLSPYCAQKRTSASGTTALERDPIFDA
jgi:hypothetical protein